MHTKSDRVFGLDLIRCLAAFFVISVHFFLNSGYYNTPLEGKRMFVLAIIRWLTFTCVPLFLILTGFLNRKKSLSKKYYKRIIPILYEYLICSILCIIFNIAYLNNDVPVKKCIISILGFSAAPYSWYVNMYIGLFLLIPFLNVLYNNLEFRKQKITLIISMVLIVSLPFIFNIKFQILPDFWVVLYPIMYYFIGMYLAEYEVRISRLISILVILFVPIIEALVSFKFSKGLNWTPALDNYGAFPTTIVAISIFLLLYKVTISNNIIKNLIESISNCTLSIYLISWIFDTIIYKKLNVMFNSVQTKMPYYFIAVLAIFILSYLTSLFVIWSYKLIKKVLVASNILKI